MQSPSIDDRIGLLPKYAGNRDLNSQDLIARHCKPDGISKRYITDNLARQQEVTIIDERNLYRLMGRSDDPNAELFQDWVYCEVLSSIHKLDLATSELVDLAKTWIEAPPDLTPIEIE